MRQLHRWAQFTHTSKYTWDSFTGGQSLRIHPSTHETFSQVFGVKLNLIYIRCKYNRIRKNIKSHVLIWFLQRYFSFAIRAPVFLGSLTSPGSPLPIFIWFPPRGKVGDNPNLGKKIREHLDKQSRQGLSYVCTLLEQYKAIVKGMLSALLITERYKLLQCNWVDRMGWKGINQNSNTTFSFFLSL